MINIFPKNFQRSLWKASYKAAQDLDLETEKVRTSSLCPVLKHVRTIFRNSSDYTCDKQVLWESAGAFFPRDNSLISRGNSHVSRVRGLVVRCLPFNPEVSCSDAWVCANFFTSILKQKVLTFFGTMRLFGFVRLFFEIF